MDFSPRSRSGDHFCCKELTFKLSLSDYETVAKVFCGEGERPFIPSVLWANQRFAPTENPSLGEHKVRPYSWATQRVAYGKNIHLIANCQAAPR